MNSNLSRQESPLSRLLEDDTLTIIETVLPYCRPHLAKMLAVQMKILEIQKILTGFDDEPRLRACGFEDSSVDVESVLRTLRNSVSEEKAQQIDSILNFIRFSRVYQNWQETMQSHPELMQLLNQSLSSGNRSSGEAVSEEKGAGTGNPLSDPSLFMMLSSAMNRGGNVDMNEMLSTLMKKQGN
ncbi:MAG TPA: hypothetical protein H9934_07745 [Candidatus Anaerobutyricum faecale]|uniref:hypothetical protein n=1 Tax=Eubacterium sp. An11 TaxID=1965542 RepID=UPI000B3680A3|nr:hypothetical protein [Eubacterium sp. An11]OUQ63242.1 hypothetical protein B5E53_16225 [Eubacterium sp. An11]HJC32008.1 hypothetical protein [Candidatus Anaerobutyricum faecale]